MFLQDILGAGRTLGARADDDYIDRINYYFTSNILIALSIATAYKMYNSKPMECILPKRFSSSVEQV